MDVNEHKRHARPGRRRWSHPDKIIKSKKTTRTGFEPVRSKTKRLSLASVEYEILGVPVNLSGTLSSICRAAWVMLFRVPTSQFLCYGFHMRRSLFFYAAWHACVLARKDMCAKTNTLHMARAMSVSLECTPRVDRRLKKTNL